MEEEEIRKHISYLRKMFKDNNGCELFYKFLENVHTQIAQKRGNDYANNLLISLIDKYELMFFMGFVEINAIHEKVFKSIIKN